MNLYSIDIKIAATVYIKAETKKAALTKAKTLVHDEIEVIEDPTSELPIVGYRFDSEDLPEISLSPAMTLRGPWGRAVWLAEENVPTS